MQQITGPSHIIDLSTSPNRKVCEFLAKPVLGQAMRLCTSKSAMRKWGKCVRRAGKSIALVPTMGYLHQGHLSLVREAQCQADAVVVSIFVNPRQFGPNEDLATYPRDTDRDLKLLEQEAVSAVFLPEADEMYGAAGATYVDVPELSNILQGALRPGHFQGVATVVTKLFNIVQPDVAVFGEKDYQQLILVRQLVNDLDLPLRIVGVPTVREEDGLAMSSRNVRLKDNERAQAAVLFEALKHAENAALQTPLVSEVRGVVSAVLREAKLGCVETIDICDAMTLEPLEGRLDRKAVVLLTVRFGSVLLIDQRIIEPAGP